MSIWPFRPSAAAVLRANVGELTERLRFAQGQIARIEADKAGLRAQNVRLSAEVDRLVGCVNRYTAVTAETPPPRRLVRPCLDQQHRLCLGGGCVCTSPEVHPRRYVPDPETFGPAEMDPNPRPWYFTFRMGQIHPVLAAPLDSHYVVIEGTHGQTRAEMVRRFGHGWSHQYSSAADAGVTTWSLMQLHGAAALGVLAPPSGQAVTDVLQRIPGGDL